MSGIQFVLEHWVNTNGIYTQSRTITGIDGAGNAGAWSDTWELTTST